MITLSLHYIDSIKLSPIRQLPRDGSHVRDIIITDSDGREVCVTLFADAYGKLCVSANSDKVKA